MIQNNSKISITKAAKIIGVVPKTIIRWEQSGKIKKAKRDWRNWRVYTTDDLHHIKDFYEEIREA